jgi:RNA-binding protein
MSTDREESEAREAAVTGARLAGYQRTYLRGLAHHLKPVVQVGQAGITEAVLEAVEQALADHELIKVRLHKPEDKKALAAELAARSGAELCGILGHLAILYRAHPEEPRIALPARGTAGDEP